MRFVGINSLQTRLQCLRGCLFAIKGTYTSRSQSMATFSSTHDYIICGAGSAGCVLGNRLSTDPNNKVLLLEGGSTDEGVTDIEMPLGFHFTVSKPHYNWYYSSVPQKNLNNRDLFCPRGKVMGGSSSINAMVYMRGHAYDFDRWESEGAKGWSYADCLPYFKKLETHELGASEYHGTDGPMYATKSDTSIPLFQAFVKAGQQAGYPYTDDMNGFQQEGFGSFHSSIYNGTRCSTSYAYIKPIKETRQKQLQVETDALVTKILFDGTKAIGVEYLQNNEKRRAQANKDVIISGGAINSPQLLMLSGIGDADELKQHGIAVVSHLPGVGQNLQDHLAVYIQQACPKPVSIWQENPELARLENTLEWVRTKSGPGTTSFVNAGAFIKSSKSVSHPDIQFHFFPIAVRDHLRTVLEELQQHGYMIAAGPLRSQSKGTIKLRSSDPRDYPLVDFNYMSTDQDWIYMRTCVRLGREVFQQEAFDEYRGEELYPGKNVRTDKEIDEFVRNAAETIYHPTCSCKMGDSSDKMAVVDNETRVFGVDGLRVVDASIMPSITSGNTNVPTIMIAEKAADHILGNPMLHRCQVPVY